MSNAFEVLEGANLSNVSATFNGAPISRLRAALAVAGAGANLNPGAFQINTFDFVGNVLGGNTWNPIKYFGSILASPLLFTPLSSHTVYGPPPEY